MSTTTALDLLALADLQTRRLRQIEVAATAAQWESFDVTLHRLLLELTGPHAAYVNHDDPSRVALTIAARSYPTPLRLPVDTELRTRDVAAYLDTTTKAVVTRVRRGTLHAVKDGPEYRYASSSLDQRPDIRPADPNDPHPLARASCALGAMADLIREARQHGPAVLHRDGEVAGATLHVLSLAAVAARHTIAHGSLDDAIRPVLVGRYAERVVDTLRDHSLRPASLDHLTCVTPETEPATVNDRLEAALHVWNRTARSELNRLIPSVDVLRQIANQGAHLCHIRASLEGPDESQTTQLRALAGDLDRAEKAWGSLTTLTRPGHEFVTASRDLYATLQTLQTRHARRELDNHRAQADLDRGLASIADLMSASRSLPKQFLSACTLRGPARALPTSDDRLPHQRRGTYVLARRSDAPDLVPAWERAAAIAQMLREPVIPQNIRRLSL